MYLTLDMEGNETWEKLFNKVKVPYLPYEVTYLIIAFPVPFLPTFNIRSGTRR